MLTGTEVKSLRQGRASLVDGYAFIDGGEAYLDAVHIPEYNQGTWTNHPPRRTRKLLLHKQQILKLYSRVKEGGYTLVPLSLYFSDGKAKVELAVAKGKREYDKRQALRERQDRREARARDVDPPEPGRIGPSGCSTRGTPGGKSSRRHHFAGVSACPERPTGSVAACLSPRSATTRSAPTSSPSWRSTSRTCGGSRRPRACTRWSPRPSPDPAPRSGRSARPTVRSDAVR